MARPQEALRTNATVGDLPVHIRWMIRRDMPSVLAIEQECFEFPWYEDDFIRCLRQRNCIGMVAEHGERVVGFMIYELHKAKLQVLNFAVAGEFRRGGVGRGSGAVPRRRSDARSTDRPHGRARADC